MSISAAGSLATARIAVDGACDRYREIDAEVRADLGEGNGTVHLDRISFGRVAG
jgi:hypothetical protein